MRTTATVAQWLVRVTGLIQIVLGLAFWTGNQLALVPLHMLLGLVLVLALWTLAFVGARSGVQPGLVAAAFVWGLVVPILGVTQGDILTTGPHWLIQVLHLLVGLAAIGLAEAVGARIRRSGTAAAA
jgi:hypothetical protein